MKLRDVARSTVTMTHMGEKRAAVAEEREDHADASRDFYEIAAELHLSLVETVQVVERLKRRGAVLSGVEAIALERARRLLNPNDVFSARGRRRARSGERGENPAASKGD